MPAVSSNPDAGIQVQAGVLLLDRSGLTTKAKKRFIDDVKKLLREGSANVGNIPCGPDVQPVSLGALENLDDPEQFPDFHENFLGPNSAYYNVALALDVKGQAPFFPIVFDPFGYFNVAVSVPLPFSIPDIDTIIAKIPAANLPKPIDPVKIQAKLSVPPVPTIPALPPFPPDFDPRFKALIDYVIGMIKAPVLGIPDIVKKIPQIFPDIAADLPNALLELGCVVFDSLFAAIDPRFITQIAATKVLTARISECIAYDAIGLSMGSADPSVVGAPGYGLVGAVATSHGLGSEADETTVKKEEEETERTVEQTEETLRKNGENLLVRKLPAGYLDGSGSSRGFTQAEDPGQQKFQDITQLTLAQLEQKDVFISTCGFLCHWYLHRLGCRQKEIINRNDSSAGLKYETGQNLWKLRQGASTLGAWVNYREGKLPKKGDIVMIQNDNAIRGSGDPLLQGNDGSRVDTPKEDYTSQHVFIFLEELRGSPDPLWNSADAGQGGVGTQRAVFKDRIRRGQKLISQDGIERDIVGWVDISKLKYDASPKLF